MFDHSAGRFPSSTHFRTSSTELLPVSTHISTVCFIFIFHPSNLLVLQPTSTHVLVFKMYVRYPPAHTIASKGVIYTRQHTFFCPEPVSTHRELDYFACPLSAHIFRFISVDSAAANFRTESGTVPPAHIFSWLVKKWFACHIVAVLAW